MISTIFTLLSILLAILAYSLYISPKITPTPTTPLGHASKPLFSSSNVLQLNHGSFGAVPRMVQEYRSALLDEQQSNPEEWFRVTLQEKLQKSKQKLAKYLNCEARDLALVENSSTGSNTVLRSLPFTDKDVIAYFNVEYATTISVVEYACEVHHCTTLKIPLPYPIESNDQVVNAFQEALRENPHISFAVFDQISSVPAIKMPLKQLIELCRARGIETFIDAAHAIGQVPVDLTELRPHYWVSNGHKWLCSPPGSAVLYVDREVQHKIHPLIISFQYGKGFENEFEWIGTRDWTAALAMDAALDFREQLGDERIMEYNNALCAQVAEFITNRWNTTLGAPLEMSASMVNIRVPCHKDVETTGECHTHKAQDTVLRLKNKSKVWVVLYDIASEERYARLSCQIYNELSDYEYFVQEYERDYLGWS